MTTNGIKGLIVDTHNWGKSVAFWKGLGYQLEFETDHHSGQLRHPAGGPYLFLRERPTGEALELTPVVDVADASKYVVPSAGELLRQFTPQHWGVTEMLLADPDGRKLSLQAPLTKPELAPEPTAVRVALWRALHLEVDQKPPVLVDKIGLELAAPHADWRARPDMNPEWTKLFRGSILGRACFVEETLKSELEKGVKQYVILGAGLDTFAQREPEIAKQLSIYEVDQPGPQEWKKKRLVECGYGNPDYLHFVPVNFEERSSWWERILAEGFDPSKPAVVVSTGVTMYITKEATAATMRQIEALAFGSTYITTFMPPLELIAEDERTVAEQVNKAAHAAGTPFISFYSPQEIVALATECGLRAARHVTGGEMARYFAGRTDGLRWSTGEQLMIARV